MPAARRRDSGRRRFYDQSVPRVVGLSIAPVKSLALVHPDELVLEPDGVRENRRFYLVGPDGRVVNGLRCGKLVAVTPAYDPASELLALTFPDGATATGTIELGERVTTPWGERSVTGRVVHGPWADALSRFAERPLRLVKAEGSGACSHDGVSILSQASVEELTRRAAAPAPVDDRRFRMLLTIGGCGPHEEDAWTGRTLAIGDARVRVTDVTARCGTTTHHPVTGERDFDTLRAIKSYRGLSARRTIDFGVYAAVERPGRVRVGDPVTIA
jgi:uncharacterized protein